LADDTSAALTYLRQFHGTQTYSESPNKVSLLPDKNYPPHEYQPKPHKDILEELQAEWEVILKTEGKDYLLLFDDPPVPLEYGRVPNNDNNLLWESEKVPDFTNAPPSDDDIPDPHELGNIVRGKESTTIRRTTRTRAPRARALSLVKTKMLAHLTSTVTDGMTLEEIMEQVSCHPDFPVLSMYWDHRYNGSDKTIEMMAETRGIPRPTLSTKFEILDKQLETFVNTTDLKEKFPNLDLSALDTHWVAVVTLSGKAYVVKMAHASAPAHVVVDALDRARDKTIRTAKRDIRSKRLGKAETERQINKTRTRISEAFRAAPISAPIKMMAGLQTLAGSDAESIR